MKPIYRRDTMGSKPSFIASFRTALESILTEESALLSSSQRLADEIATLVEGSIVAIFIQSDHSGHFERLAVAGTDDPEFLTGENADRDQVFKEISSGDGSFRGCEFETTGFDWLEAQESVRTLSTFPLKTTDDSAGVVAVFTADPLDEWIMFGIEMGVALFSEWCQRKETKSTTSEIRDCLNDAPESDAKFRTFFDQGTHFAGILDLDGRVIEANRLAVEGCGFTREEIVGKYFWDCGWWDPSPDLKKMVREGFKSTCEGNVFRAESAFFLADGKQRHVDFVMTCVKDEAGNTIYIAPTGTDITDRVEAGEALRESRTALKFMLDTAQLGDWDLNLLTGKARTSLRHDQCFGFDEPIPEDEWGFERFLSYVHPDDRGQVEKAFRKAVEDHRDWEVQCQVVWEDGSLHWLEIHGSVYHTSEGLAVRMLGVVEDITARKQAEQELQEMQERDANILNSITDGFIALDDDWRYTFVNKQALEILGPVNGYEEGYVGEILWEVFPDLVGTAVERNFRRSKSERTTSEFEFYFPPLDIWFSIKSYPSRDGLSVYFQDISQRRTAEAELRSLKELSEQQTRLYETILSATPDLIYVFDRNHRFTYANRALLSMWGKDWNDAIGRNCLELGYEDWHAALHDREIEQVIATKKPIRGEVPFTGTGGRRIYDYIFVPVLGSDGEVEAVAGTTRDVTERKQSEEELADSRERLQAALDGSGAGTYRWNIQTDDVDWDETLDAFFGLPPGETVKSLDQFLAGIHPDDRGEVVERCQRSAEYGTDFSMEFRVVRPDGSTCWLDDKGKTFLDDSGKPHYIAGTCIDVTERKLAQQWETSQRQVLELIAEDAPLEEVFDAVIGFIEGQATEEMFASILLLDENGRNLRHGSAPSLPGDYCKAVDGLEIGNGAGSCGTAAFLKRPVYVIDIESDPLWKDFAPLALPHNLRACWSIPIFSSVEREVLGTFAMYYTTPREPRPDEMRLVEIAPRLIAIAIERKRSREKIKASAERLQFMAESMPQKIFSADASGKIDYFNRQWMKYTGMSFEEISGWNWADLIHPDDRADNIRVWKNCVETGAPFQFEHRIRNKDGEYRWHLSRAHPMRNDEGKVILWFGSNTDINTARLNLEEISRISRAKDEFLAALSHELRTPLTPVLMMAATLENDTTLSSNTRDAFSMIRRNVELEARLIDDLLDLTRITNGKLHLDRKTAGVHELIDQAAEIATGDSDSKRIEIQKRYKAKNQFVPADPTRLQQVFWNLIKNSLKFTPDGGKIIITTENGPDDDIIISVTDTGIGIDRDTLKDIFNAFEQGAQRNHHQYGGLGLGLAISNAIVEAHHGEIRAESDGENKGASFTVTLKTVNPPAGDETNSDPAPVCGEASPMRLLIVEDHENTRNTLKKLLTHLGYRVKTASSVKEALEIFEPGKFDSIVSDLGLPDGNGLDLMREIQTRQEIPAIAMSGYGMKKDREQSREAGFNHHLVKPVKIDELQSLLEQIEGS
ncbi:MAG: PAS domain S-box protein [Verrucomicrobiales bacterium]|nr:PAS domain S-box protein [Verrucomicrobiales bacterium]